jgi:uncharacterized protein (TIGR03083 family)
VSSPARPVTTLDKTEILDGLFASWEDIDRLMAVVPASDWNRASPLPGWCVQDVLSHIIGTEAMMAGVPTPEADIDISALEHVRNPIGQLNECWVRHLSTEDAAAMLARFRDITAQRRTALAALSEADWNAVTATPAGPDSYGRFMRIRTFDCWMHEQDIRHGLGRPPADADLEGPAAQRALDEVTASMAFVVGKLGKAPDGSRVALELTGPLARTIRVAVDGRAALVDDFGADAPTTAIRLDGLQFTQLCGGRPMFENRSQSIEYDGDAEVGRRVVENLNYVI